MGFRGVVMVHKTGKRPVGNGRSFYVLIISETQPQRNIKSFRNT
jgi:hypothetical protein